MVAIRKIAARDAGPVRDLIQGILEKEFAVERCAYAGQDLEDPVRYYGGGKDIFLVAEQDGAIVGTVAIKEESPDTALLRRIFLDSKFRGRGLGAQLLRKAMEFCFDQRYQNVVFRGTQKMQAAVRLCLKEGFRETEVAALGDVKMYVLTKALAPGGERRPEAAPAPGPAGPRAGRT